MSQPDDAAAGFGTDGPETWHHVHPVSPFVRGWVAVLAVLFIFGRNGMEDLFRGLANGGDYAPNTAPVWVILSIVGAAVVVFGISFYLSWRFTRYQVTDEYVHINSGVVFRQQRKARIERVQAIDVVQPLLARVFGLAELKFDVADGGKSAMKLAFLKLDEARRLRSAILARAAGLPADPQGPAVVVEAPEQVVLALTPGRVVGSVLLSGITVMALVLSAGVALLVVRTGSVAVLAAFIPMVLGVVAAYWQRFTTDFNFRVAVSPDGVRLHYGMLETRSQTIPPGRVQAVGLSQGPVWRMLGWYKIHVNVAGYGADAREGGTRTVVLPVGTQAEAMVVLGLLFPDPGVDNPHEVFAAGLNGTGDAQGFIHSPPAARWIDPLAWRRTAYRATATALLCRHGILYRRLQVVPHERTQSLSLYQGPIMRALGLVDFELHSTAGPVRPVVHHMDLAAAHQLFDEQAARAAVARRIHRSERWMEAAPAPLVELVETASSAPAASAAPVAELVETKVPGSETKDAGSAP
ncbi:PH domain-containing protein [Arthrobacter sp. 35W]|uniref:PH domain-containing protein n=1 Tax=Arthrobacter sp. 35W TaxID=1132441 RepID=UPI0003FE369C|nr:PH domain-containing protein [Arthrobacter sp. 35W]